MQPFQISYQDVFGSTISHDLKENGSTIMVNNCNRQVRNVHFVEIVSECRHQKGNKITFGWGGGTSVFFALDR